MRTLPFPQAVPEKAAPRAAFSPAQALPWLPAFPGAVRLREQAPWDAEKEREPESAQGPAQQARQRKTGA